MQVLIVYAHLEPKSFNGALKDQAVRVLTGLGHEVEVSDLYAMGFQAAASRDDFTGPPADPTHFKYGPEGGHAFRTGTLAPDIRAEQEKLLRADALILQFPLWWFGLPAILKGWIDRVLTIGFAYGGGHWYDAAPLSGRRALLSLTTGGPPSMYGPGGLSGHIDVNLWPIQNGVLRFCGFAVLPPFVAYGAAAVSAEQRVAYLAAYEQRLHGLFTDEPLVFHPLSDFDATLKLKPGVEPQTVGQRAGWPEDR